MGENKIVICWENGLGNSLFQYVFGKILSLVHNSDLYFLDARTYDQIDMLSPIQYGLLSEKYVDKISLEEFEELNTVDIMNPVNSKVYGTYRQFYDKFYSKINILLRYHPLLADYRIYENYLEDIRSWFPELNEEKNHNDVVMHIRLGDYLEYDKFWNVSGKGCCIDIDAYDRVLSGIKFDKLYICTDDPYHKYLDRFRKNGAIVVSTETRKISLKDTNLATTVKDFNFIRSFDKIVVGNSTFSWWAAALSDASEIYVYRPFLKNSIDRNFATPEENYFFYNVKYPVNLGETSYPNWHYYE